MGVKHDYRWAHVAGKARSNQQDLDENQPGPQNQAFQGTPYGAGTKTREL